MRLKSFSLFLLLLYATASLAQMDAPKKATLTGHVLSSTSGEPVRKVSLALHRVDGPADALSTSTDGDGHFSFENVEPGSYRLAAQRVGFSPTEYGATASDRPGTVFTLSGDQPLDLTLKLLPLGVISGHVFDSDGDPIVGASVVAVRYTFANGRREFRPVPRVHTNDLGEYRMYDLLPGRYYVSATYRHFVPADSHLSDDGYGLIFYPNVLDMSMATPVDVPAGGTQGNIDLAETKVRRVKVSGSVVNPPGGDSVSVALVPRDSAIPGKFSRLEAEYRADGKFEIHSVAPGTYTIVAGAAGAARRLTARQVLSVGSSDVDGIAITLSPNPDIHGRIQVENQSQFDLSGFHLTLQSHDGSGGGGHGATNVNTDGTFTLSDLVPDNYIVNVTGMPQNCYVKSMRVGDTDVVPSDVDLTQGGTLSIVVSLAAGSVGGTVENDKQQPTGGALVALIPYQRQRSELYRSVVTDSTGAFSLKGITPGSYRIFAWQGVDRGMYLDPEFLKPYEDEGQAVTLSENSTLTLQLKTIPIQDGN